MNPDGILLVDKPRGVSSAGLVARIKRALGGPKSGHAGTLDPFATGLMLICLGKATRISRYFLGGDKCYEASLLLGSTTDTLDPEGQITATAPVPFLDQGQILETFERFTGPILQRPPIYSALKHQGVPLYRLARQGKAVEKPARPVTIHSLKLLESPLPEIRFEVHCSAGTYIRTLAADLAEAFGTVGHLSALRRTACCGFNVQEALLPEKLLDGTEGRLPENLPIPMGTALGFMPEIHANNTLTEKVFHGKVLFTADLPGTLPAKTPLRVLDASGRLIAVIRKEKEDAVSFSYDAVLAHADI